MQKHCDTANNFEIREINVILQLKYFHNHVNETNICQIRYDKKSVKQETKCKQNYRRNKIVF